MTPLNLHYKGGSNMPDVISELIISVDGFAKGAQSPGYYGFFGSEFGDWLAKNADQPHQTVIGRRTYELLNTIPTQARDEGTKRTVATPGWLYSRTLETAEWPNLKIIRSDVCEHIRELKQREGDEIRTLGSLSLVRQLLSAGLVDRLRLIMCPLVIPQTGLEPAFAGLPDLQFKLLACTVLDERIVILDYQPGGSPPYTSPDTGSA